MGVTERIAELASALESETLPKAEREWGGADVAIVTEIPEWPEDSFYGPPRWVRTEHPLELSWLMEQMYHAFSEAGLLDCCSKYEFIGRLANAINRQQELVPGSTAHQLYWAMLAEANAMHFEMLHGAFCWLEVAPAGVIHDDLRAR